MPFGWCTLARSAEAIPDSGMCVSFKRPRSDWHRPGPGRTVEEFDMAQRTCSIEGCDGVHWGRGWCKTHWYRWRRHGDPMALILDSTARTVMSHGYIIVRRRGHPLSDEKGRVYEHRAVMYAMIGPQPHPCHWCGRTLRWEAQHGYVDWLMVDHLNHDKGDNRPSNLVPSCNACNTSSKRARRSPREKVRYGQVITAL